MSRRTIGFSLGAMLIVSIAGIWWWRMMAAPAETYPLAITADGGAVAYAEPGKKDGLRFLQVATGIVRIVGPSGLYHSIAFNPDASSLIASYSKDGEAWRLININLRSGSADNLTDDGGNNDFWPVFESEAKLLFWRFTRRSGDLFGGTNPSGFQIYRLDLRTKDVSALTTNDYYGVSGIVLYKPGKLLFQSRGGLFELDLETGALRPVPMPEERFTPLCETDIPGGVIGSGDMASEYEYDLFKYVIGREYDRLTRLKTYIEDAKYSPMTKTVICVVSRPNYKMWKLNLDSGELGQIVLADSNQ